VGAGAGGVQDGRVHPTLTASPSAPVTRTLSARRSDLTVALIAAVVVIVDQLSKSWAEHALQTRTIHVAWTLQFALAHNTGAAFSLLSGRGAGPAIALLAVIVVVVLARSSRSLRTPLGTVAVGLVLGGALGNLCDRVFRSHNGFLQGGVVDFIDFQWWPVFNVADACIVVGAITLGAVAVFTHEP